jgi:hypothetical protein
MILCRVKGFKPNKHAKLWSSTPSAGTTFLRSLPQEKARRLFPPERPPCLSCDDPHLLGTGTFRQFVAFGSGEVGARDFGSCEVRC